MMMDQRSRSRRSSTTNSRPQSRPPPRQVVAALLLCRIYCCCLIVFLGTTTTVVAAFRVGSDTKHCSFRRRTSLWASTRSSNSKKGGQAETSATSSNQNGIQEEKIPANLRRKVQAQRPMRGHVVPKQSRQRQQQQTWGGSGGTGPQLRPQGKDVAGNQNNPRLLRITAGTARGRKLDSPQVFLRPMMGKVREAVFSTLTSFGLYDTKKSSSMSKSSSLLLAPTRHLDIFAGSGSVGLESLSRGASHCTFVDLSDDCCNCIERNLEWTGLWGDKQERGRVVCADAVTALTNPTAVGIPADSTYQIVTLCPPYEEVIYGDLLEAAVKSPLVTDDTIILVEYPVELGCLPHVIAVSLDDDVDKDLESSSRKNAISSGEQRTAVGIRNRRYGRTVIAMYVVNPTGRLDKVESRPEEFVQV